jgi:hypothetical protein
MTRKYYLKQKFYISYSCIYYRNFHVFITEADIIVGYIECNPDSQLQNDQILLQSAENIWAKKYNSVTQFFHFTNICSQLQCIFRNTGYIVQDQIPEKSLIYKNRFISTSAPSRNHQKFYVDVT